MARDHDDTDTKQLSDDDTGIDYEDEDDSDSLWHDIRSAWKQHLVAIVVALVAAVLGYTHFNLATAATTTTSNRQAWQDMSENMLIRHVHVRDFRRMANVTFCGAQDLSNTMMEYRIPRELLPALERYYQADAEEDDNYRKDANTAAVAEEHADLECARQQAVSSHFVKGFASVYRTPSIQQMTRDTRKVKPRHSPLPGFCRQVHQPIRQTRSLLFSGRLGEDTPRHIVYIRGRTHGGSWNCHHTWSNLFHYTCI
jgi:hypothetical protein